MIRDALKGYEHVDRLRFSFHGPYAAGYKFDIRKEHMNPNATKLGFAINTSEGDGSHWVGLFIDLTKNRADYFDSLGESLDCLV
jgi:hypothetical protein